MVADIFETAGLVLHVLLTKYCRMQLMGGDLFQTEFWGSACFLLPCRVLVNCHFNSIKLLR